MAEIDQAGRRLPAPILVCMPLPTHYLTVTTFGYDRLQQGELPPPANVLFDVRDKLPDPSSENWLRDLNGRDLNVELSILDLPGADEVVASIVADVFAVMAEKTHVSLAIGSRLGRYRPLALAAHVLMHVEHQFPGTAIGLRHMHADWPMDPI
jgi:RNase adaptor protein for sRNA GlmZ degradation